jgi:hypothetical protein
MRKLKNAAAYVWAAAAFAIVAAVFPLREGLAVKIAETGVVISPVFSGGPVARVMEHGAYRAFVHRPVFDALIGERNTGFIQVDWGPVGSLPAVLEEKVDFDNDGKTDFTLILDTREQVVRLQTGDCRAGPAGRVYRLNEHKAISLYGGQKIIPGPGSIKRFTARVALRKICRQ